MLRVSYVSFLAWFPLGPPPRLAPRLNRRSAVLTGGEGLGGGTDLRKEFADVYRVLAVGAVHGIGWD